MRKVELRTLNFIEQYCLTHNDSPSIQEIADGIEYQSRGSVHRYVESLIKQGYLIRTGKHRGLRCTGKSIGQLTIPLLGRIAAGKPIEAINADNTLDVTALFSGADRYVLQVTGESMINAGIHDGDYVVLRKTETANNGDIVAALIDNYETTLKRLKLYRSRIRLIPENDTMSAVDYSPDRVTIQGVLIAQMRTY